MSLRLPISSTGSMPQRLCHQTRLSRARLGLTLAITLIAFGAVAQGCSSGGGGGVGAQVLVLLNTVLGGGVEGQSYSHTFSASGGLGGYQFTMTGNPGWLSLNPTSGELIGTPPAGASASSPFSFTVTVTDAGTDTDNAVVNLAITPPGALTLGSTTLAPGAEGQAYTHTFTASGGIPTYTFTMSGNPGWLALNPSSGQLTGTPPAGSGGSSPYNFTVMVADTAAGNDSQAVTLTVNPPPPLTLGSTTLPPATEAVPYSHTFTATGGIGAYTFTMSGNPGWLALNPTSGQLTGTPPAGASASSPFTFNVMVVDTGTGSDNANVNLVVNTPPIAGPWVSRGIGGGGALYSASLSPHDANDLYIVTDMSAVFHSTDFGQNWTTLNFQQLRGGQDTLVQYTSDPNTMYAAHGGLFDGRHTRKTTDGGTTWTPTADPTGDDTVYVFADHTAANRLVITDYNTVYFSNDGGASFNSRYTAATGGGIMLGGAFWDGNNIFLGTNDGLIVSTDGGGSFSNAGMPASGQGICAMAGAKAGATTRLVAITMDSGDLWGGISPWDLTGASKRYWRRDYPAGWTEITGNVPAGLDMWFIGMPKNNIDVIYGGGTQNFRPAVGKTINGGNTWSSVMNTVNNGNVTTGYMGEGGDLSWGWAESALGFGVSPIDPNRVIIVDWGFAHVTDDGGATWTQAYVNRAMDNPAGSPTPTGQAYSGVGLEQTADWWLHWANATTIIGGFTDIRGLRSTDSGQSWTNGSALGLPHNSTYCVVEHPTNGNLYAATSTVHDMYQSTYLQDSRIDGGDGHVIMSVDDGASWTTLHDFNHPVIWLAFDPNDANTMYASVIHSTQGGIFVSTNLNLGASSTWTKLADPPRTEGHPFNIHCLSDGTLVASYSGRRNSGGAFTLSSGVFVSTNGGTSWIDRSHTDMQRWTKDVVIDPHDSTQNTWYACVFSHWGAFPNDVGGLFRTTDRGLNWTRLNNLYRVNSITIDPTDANHAWITTETDGLYETTNLTSGTPTFTADADFPFQHPMRVFVNPFNTNQVWVTTFGNGFYVKN